MWPVIMAIARRNAVYFTLPFAGVIGKCIASNWVIKDVKINRKFYHINNSIIRISAGFIGYHIENFISDKYTPYNGKCVHLTHIAYGIHNLLSR